MTGTRFAALLVSMVLPLTAVADELWKPGLEIGGGLMHTSMQEMVNGSAQIKEDGFLPESHGRFFLHQGQLEFGASLEDAVGTIDYQGFRQSALNPGQQSPYSTQTDTAFLKAQLDAALSLGMWRLDAFSGYHVWRRSVVSSEGVGTSNEDYRWRSYGLGASCHIPFLHQGQALEPGIKLWRNYRVRQTASSGGLDTAHLQPGGRDGVQLSVALAWALPSKAEVRVRPFVQFFRFAESAVVLSTENGQPIPLQGGYAASYQPEIRYQQMGVDVDYRLNF